MATKFKPLGNYVLIEPAKAAEQTKSGLYIPQVAQDRPNQGTVIAVGSGSQNDQGNLLPMRVKVGDGVLFPKYAGTELSLDDVKYYLIRETDLLGVVEK